MIRIAQETGRKSMSITSDLSIKLSQTSSNLIGLRFLEIWISIVILLR